MLRSRGCQPCCIGACCITASVRVGYCIGDAPPSRSAPSFDALYGVLRELRDWAKGGLCDGLVAVRCTRAQTGYDGGGVLSMGQGTALFDAVAISDTEAGVRAGRGGVASRADACEGGCRRTACGSGKRGYIPRMRRSSSWSCRLIGSAPAAAWFAWAVGSSRSRAARSRTARRCVRA